MTPCWSEKKHNEWNNIKSDRTWTGLICQLKFNLMPSISIYSIVVRYTWQFTANLNATIPIHSKKIIKLNNKVTKWCLNRQLWKRFLCKMEYFFRIQHLFYCSVQTSLLIEVILCQQILRESRSNLTLSCPA